jgi:hypothetical protein
MTGWGNAIDGPGILDLIANAMRKELPNPGNYSDMELAQLFLQMAVSFLNKENEKKQRF